MKKGKSFNLFRRHFFLISLTTLFLVLLIFFAFHLSFIYQRERLLPPQIAFLVDAINAVPRGVRVETISKINQSKRKPGEDRFIYLEKKQLLELASQEKWTNFKIPGRRGDFSLIERGTKKSFLVRLEGGDFLLLDTRTRPFLFPFFLLFIVGAILVAAGISSILYYHLFSKMSDMLEEMINQIKSGNLKARLSIDKKNEISETKEKFNKMADEIEKLVQQIQATETNRLRVLQQLAHDLRTPIASQKNLLETLKEKENSLDISIKREFIDLAIKESYYFERLVEDLLFLAMLVEPHYVSGKTKVDLNNIAKDLVKSYQVQDEINSKNINLEFSSSDGDAYILADPHHIERLLRNLLSNAVSFANSSIKVEILKHDHYLALKIIDDGKGFDKVSLNNFGVKKFSRSNLVNSNRLSIGLGSVIVKAICEKLNGKLFVTNRFDEQGNISGAQVSIEFSLFEGV